MSRHKTLERLHATNPAILPSLLLCDFGNLEREVARLEKTEIVGLHLDVMDGVFVPNITYGMPIVAALRKRTNLPLDVHLMISDPRRYVRAFCEAGADLITIHAEAADDPRSLLMEIRELDVAAGIAFNPETPMRVLESCADLCDLVLVMSVPAGFGGQSFSPVALDRLAQVRETVGPDALLQVDGGLNRQTIGDCAAAGAQLFVVGSTIFRSECYEVAVHELLRLARGG